MKILILSRDFRQLGGVVNFVGNLKKCLGTEMVAEDFRIGARIGKSSRIGKLLCPLWDSVRLARLVTRGQYDVIHLNPSLDARAVLREGLFLLTLILLGKANRTFVLFHGWSTEVEQGVRGHQALRALFVAVFGRAAVVGVLGSIFRKSLRDIGLKESRVKVLTTMFDGKELLGVQRDRAWEGRTVLFLSRFAREKGAYELLQAFREVSKRVPDVRLVLAGDGPERANLEQWVGDHELAARVVFTGYVRGREKARDDSSGDNPPPGGQ
jgi:glycosyltransferase involved in cell wall biosynthesis